jgi:hypothetical protein
MVVRPLFVAALVAAVIPMMIPTVIAVVAKGKAEEGARGISRAADSIPVDSPADTPRANDDSAGSSARTRYRQDFAWVERNTRGPTGVGRGYLVLVSPDEWQGRWVGTSLVDPTPTQPNTWHGTRTPPLTTLPKLREILPRLQLNRKP